MKKLKIGFIMLIVFCSVFLLTACNTDPKTFEKEEFSIVMPGDYRDGKAENIFLYLKKMDSGLSVIKETPEALANAGVSVANLDEYVAVIKEKNNLTEDFINYTDENITFKYLYYSREDKKNSYFYLAVVLKNQNDYFLCNFFCSESKKDDFRDNFLEWSKTIKFNNG